MAKKKYEKPAIQTVSSRQILESIGPASAGYGDVMLDYGD
jgi:hypothetical protein